MTSATPSHGRRRARGTSCDSGGLVREFTGRKLSYDRELSLRAAKPCLTKNYHELRIMTRYEYEDESGSSKTLLIAAGVVAGLVAGAAAAHQLGGWRGISRRIRRGRGPVYAFLRDAISPELLGRLLQGGGGVLESLIGSATGPSSKRSRRTERFDPDLDEYEVEEWERAAAGVDLDDENDEGQEENADEAPTAEEIERDVLEIFSRSRSLRRRPIEIACDDDGVVALRGTVRSPREARLARRLAASVEGVVRVDAALEVRAPQAS
jgi:hypothetical protein